MKRSIDDRKGIASTHICNTTGIVITEIEYDTNDYIHFNLVSDAIISSHKRKLEDSVKRGAFFRFSGCRWYLDEFLKI